MVKQSQKTAQRQPLIWPMVFSCLLTVIAVLSFTIFTLAHWVEKQVLTTDTWTQTVGSLPKNDEVASALSSYTINQLITNTDLETTIEQALPPRAGFLAAPLTDQIQSFLTKQTKRIIQSDQFESVWIATNKAIVNRIVTGARADTSDDARQPAQLSVPLTLLRNSIVSVLTNRGIIAPPEPTANGSSLIVNLKTSVGELQKQIRLIDFFNATFWLLALVGLFGALVFSRNRRTLLLIVALSIIIIGLLQLIGVRALRPTILNFFADASANAAAGVVYDTLLASFKTGVIWIIVITFIGGVIVFFSSQKILRKSKTITKWLNALKVSSVARVWKSVRVFFMNYRWYIVGAAFLIGLILIAFVIPVSWQSATVTLLSIILLAELTSLIAAGRPRRVPMEHPSE